MVFVRGKVFLGIEYKRAHAVSSAAGLALCWRGRIWRTRSVAH
jgi:hypothetical protein